MSFMQSLKSYFVPQEINFFKRLHTQSQICFDIASHIQKFLVNQKQEDLDRVFKEIKNSQIERKEKLIELHQVFVTPVDKEAINRCYTHLYEVELSFKHLMVEIQTYNEIDYIKIKDIFSFIIETLELIKKVLQLVEGEHYEKALDEIDHIFHLNNRFSYQYANELNTLFQDKNIYHSLVNKELLAQLKSIMNHCIQYTNDLGDIIFKLN